MTVCLEVQTSKLKAVLLQGHMLQVTILHFVFEKSSEAIIDDVKELIKMNFKNKFKNMWIGLNAKEFCL